MKAKLIIIGGFLGAGKTSLLWDTAKKIKESGGSVGLITNDQASGLVDTAFLETGPDLVREVSGSCFCCNFNGFADAVMYIRDKNKGGVIIAEPVGSCADLSATLMQPVKAKYSEFIDLAPLTVLADPARLKEILAGASSLADYIILKQFEEADIILINKTDLISKDELAGLIKRTCEKWGGTTVLSASVKTGEGLNKWFNIVTQAKEAGTKIADVDYDIYAEGEAAFGWLNISFSISPEMNLEKSASNLLSALSRRFDEINVNVGHVKFILETGNKQIIANITGKADTASLRKFDRISGNEAAALTVNARVEMPPRELEVIVQEEVNNAFGSRNCKITALNSLIPGRPKPTFRHDRVV